MGQKVNPIGFRVALDKQWRSRWYSDKKHFGELLAEDQLIRQTVMKRLANAAVSKVIIERYANRVRVNIFTARPGIVIGRKGDNDVTIAAESGQAMDQDDIDSLLNLARKG